MDDRYVTEEFLELEGTQTEAELKIVTEDLKRSLYYKDNNGSWRQAAVFENTVYLSSDGLNKGKRFTGAAAGIYVNGTAKGSFFEFLYATSSPETVSFPDLTRAI